MGKSLSETNIAYLAGLIDADGAIMATIEKHPEKKFGFRVRITLKITQSNIEVINWVHKKLKFGYIRNNRKTVEWVSRSQVEIKSTLFLLKPYVVGKSNQVVLAIKIIDHPRQTVEDLLQTAKLADTLASFNVRSKNRRKNYASKIKDILSRND